MWYFMHAFHDGAPEPIKTQAMLVGIVCDLYFMYVALTLLPMVVFPPVILIYKLVCRLLPASWFEDDVILAAVPPPPTRERPRRRVVHDDRPRSRRRRRTIRYTEQ